MSARAAEELRDLGDPEETLTPWWRVLRKGGFLNPKAPGGVDRQRALLEAEGVRCSPLRKQLAVWDFAERLPRRPLEEDERPYLAGSRASSISRARTAAGRLLIKDQ